MAVFFCAQIISIDKCLVVWYLLFIKTGENDMTYEQFREKAFLLSVDGADEIGSMIYCDGRFYSQYSDKKGKSFCEDHWVFSAVSSEQSGGNCWGGYADHTCAYTIEEAYIPSLISYLSSINGLSFADGMKILNSIRVKEWEERGYYGNSKTYLLRYISYRDVYNALVKVVDASVL